MDDDPLKGNRVVSEEGTANVREWYVSRDENRWAIGVRPSETVFFGLITLTMFDRFRFGRNRDRVTV